jgi:hypothetical protein
MGSLEKQFASRRVELSLETMRDAGDVDGLYQMAVQLNRWAWVMKEQSEFAMAQSPGDKGAGVAPIDPPRHAA